MSNLVQIIRKHTPNVVKNHPGITGRVLIYGPLVGVGMTEDMAPGRMAALIILYETAYQIEKYCYKQHYSDNKKDSSEQQQNT